MKKAKQCKLRLNEKGRSHTVTRRDETEDNKKSALLLHCWVCQCRHTMCHEDTSYCNGYSVSLLQFPQQHLLIIFKMCFAFQRRQAQQIEYLSPEKGNVDRVSAAYQTCSAVFGEQSEKGQVLGSVNWNADCGFVIVEWKCHGHFDM